MFTEEAQRQCLEILSTILPSEHLVYWHCFLGMLNQFKYWQEKFPDIFIRIGPKAMNQANIESRIRDVLQWIPLTHMLTETDAPLQVPYRYTHQVHPAPCPHPLQGNPYMVPDVALFLAKITGTPVPVVCDQTVQNSKKFFNC